MVTLTATNLTSFFADRSKFLINTALNVTVFSVKEIVPDPLQEITMNTLRLTAYVQPTSKPIMSAVNVTVITESQANINVQLTEIQHIVKSLHYNFDSDDMLLTDDMFVMLNPEWLFTDLTNSVLTLESAPAAPCIGDLTINYNRVIGDITFHLEVTVDDLLQLPVLTGVRVSVPVITGDLIMIETLEDTLLFKKGITMTFDYKEV